jgi:hypothetical protein
VAQQAQDTFVITMPDGADHFITKGQVLPDGHAVVRQAPGLFARLDMGEADAAPPAKSAPEAEAPPQAKPAVKAAAKDEAKPAAGKARA